MTAIDGYQRDWEIVVAGECVDSYDREHHDISMKYMKDKIATVMSNQEIRLVLDAPLGLVAETIPIDSSTNGQNV